MCFRKLFNIDKCNALEEEKQELITRYENQLSLLSIRLEETNEKLQKIQKELDSLKDTDTEVDKYCKDRYPTREIVYTKKRYYKGISVPEDLRNYITPDSYLIKKERLKLQKNANKLIWYLTIGRHIAQLYTWTSDQTTSGESDYYLYAWETLLTYKGDCEDHSFVVSSIEPEIGFAFGFRNVADEPNSDWYGHAFNVFVSEGELFVLDTVGNDVEIYKYSDVQNLEFKINYITTQKATYVLDGSVRFGEYP